MAEEQPPAPEEATPTSDAAPASARKEFPTEEIIGWILRVGVFASAVLIALGVVLLFATQHTGYPGSFGNLAQLVQYGPNRLSAFPNNPADVLAGLAQFKPYALIALGLLLLIATPVIRVAASVVIFALERDYAYVLITLFVLLILVISFLLGKAS
ncbi:MAG TPA: DUF1634 domain-containing protein [Ktedonobacterales bacterium]|nr:DUF1634 domain-containing protein [Ktedonobacterales bacterium]